MLTNAVTVLSSRPRIQQHERREPGQHQSVHRIGSIPIGPSRGRGPQICCWDVPRRDDPDRSSSQSGPARACDGVALSRQSDRPVAVIDEHLESAREPLGTYEVDEVAVTCPFLDLGVG